MAEAARVDVVRKGIEITGVVQGVGFRPFVYRLANECNLVGFIANTSAGVSIEVQGDTENVERFLERLPKEIPPLARLTSFHATPSPETIRFFAFFRAGWMPRRKRLFRLTWRSAASACAK
jgi:hydrogenase maturation factor HypF (carbamoyltransferase family)